MRYKYVFFLVFEILRYQQIIILKLFFVGHPNVMFIKDIYIYIFWEIPAYKKAGKKFVVIANIF